MRERERERERWRGVCRERTRKRDRDQKILDEVGQQQSRAQLSGSKDVAAGAPGNDTESEVAAGRGTPEKRVPLASSQIRVL